MTIKEKVDLEEIKRSLSIQGYVLIGIDLIDDSENYELLKKEFKNNMVVLKEFLIKGLMVFVQVLIYNKRVIKLRTNHPMEIYALLQNAEHTDKDIDELINEFEEHKKNMELNKYDEQ